MATFTIVEAFRGASPPAPWFRLLEREPLCAASQLVFGTGNFANYQSADPLQLALQWLREVRDPAFAGTLDVAFAEWVERYWGESIHPDSSGSAALTAQAWQTLALIVSGHPVFERTASVLRSRLLEERNFLLAIGEGPANDPAGRALQAISRYQKDDSLRGMWFELTALPSSSPWYHGEYAIDGLSHMPHGGKGLPVGLPGGLRRLSVALAGRVSEGWLEAKLARRHFLRIAQLAQRRFPFENRWRAFWLDVSRSVHNEYVQAWIQSLWGFSKEELSVRAVSVEPDPRWRERAVAVARRFHVDLRHAIEDAEKLLAEQAEYLEATGDAYNFVRTACKLASRSPDKRTALEWVRRAKSADVYNPYTWTTELDCLLQLGSFPEALSVGIEAVARFPENVVARNTLGEVLKAQGRLKDAEEVYWETVKCFPDDVFARNGLGEVLKAQGRLVDAEQVYLETVKRFPDNVVTRNGLGEMLKAQGRLADAEQVYLETVKCFPDDVFARNGLGEVLKAQGRLADAEQVYLETVKCFPEDAVARTGLGEVLKAQGRLVDAERVYSETVKRFPQNDFARTALQALRKRMGLPELSPPIAPAIPDSPVVYEQPQGESHPHDRLRTRDIEILLTDFVLLRRWSGVNEPVDRLRERARLLIDRVGGHIYDDALLAAEGAQAMMVTDLDEALALLREATRRFPGSAKLAYARARAERLRMKQIRPAYQSEDGRQALLAWNRLARLDSVFEPVQMVGLSRTLPLLHDGEDLQKQTRDRLGILAQRVEWMIQHPPEGSFERRWAKDIRQLVFAGEAVTNADEIRSLPAVMHRLEDNFADLDALENTYLDARAVI